MQGHAAFKQTVARDQQPVLHRGQQGRVAKGYRLRPGQNPFNSLDRTRKSYRKPERNLDNSQVGFERQGEESCRYIEATGDMGILTR